VRDFRRLDGGAFGDVFLDGVSPAASEPVIKFERSGGGG
jgi:hypothetical protein